MRTTVRIDEDILEQPKTRARQENVSLTRVLSRILKAGLQADGASRCKRRSYREQVYSLGAARVALDKALALAAALEDEEIVRELARRK